MRENSAPSLAKGSMPSEVYPSKGRMESPERSALDEGWKIAHAEPIDVVPCDVLLGGVTGVDVKTRLLERHSSDGRSRHVDYNFRGTQSYDTARSSVIPRIS